MSRNPHQSPSRRLPADQDPRWRALVERDATADGEFLYAVLTTGVYCRPSCPSRRPRPENVRYHQDQESARRAGFRPCDRCRPDLPPLEKRQADLVAALCRFIELHDSPPSLEALAGRAGLSPSHTHRLFKKMLGITPHAYARARREARMRSQLEQNRSVTEALYEAGFGSSSRFYESSSGALGMTARQYRQGGAHMTIRFAVGHCVVGHFLVAATDKGVCGVYLGDDPRELIHELERRFPEATLVGADAAFEKLVAVVAGLVEEPSCGVDLPLDLRGTAFQIRVWQALGRIPAGETVTYADIARAIGSPTSSRAVANACGANPVAVAIPCHRVVRTDGSLSGYRWGVVFKRELQDRERPERS